MNIDINKKIKSLKQLLESIAVKNPTKDEWVDVNFTKPRRLDIKIISDSISYGKAKTIVSEFITEINNSTEIKMILGYFYLYTTEDAAELKISKPIKNFNSTSFADTIEYNNNSTEPLQQQEKEGSRIISFYSYKGGVGRTVALIQTAYMLAKEGKKVLLMDLDLEAPSFYEIFNEYIKNNLGLVDYLYQELYSNRKIELTEIITKLNLSVAGEIYLVHAGKMDSEYVEKLELLKEKRISENEYIQNLIKKAEKSYGINYTFIDSRTGINNWGALSIVSIANEVMLFGYPNKENISGLKLILDIIKPHKKTTVILSRIDSSDSEGNNVARKLFEELEIEQEYMPVYYDKKIALAQKYPIEAEIEEYKKISDFLLEKERSSFILKYISENADIVTSVLTNISKFELEFENIILDREDKIQEESNWILRKSKEEGIENIEKVLFKKSFIIKIKQNINDELNKILSELDTLHFEINTKVKSAIFMIYIIKLIESYENINFTAPIDFKLSSYTKCLEYINRASNLEAFYTLEELVVQMGRFTRFDFEDEDEDEKELELVNIILNIEEIPGIKENNENLKILLDLIDKINIYYSLDFKINIIVNDEYYKINEDIFKRYDVNTINLVWTDMNQINVIYDINQILEKTGLYSLSDEVFDILFNEFGKSPYFDASKALKTMDSSTFFKLFVRADFFGSTIKDMIYGKRINSNTYSKLFSDWLYNELKKKNKLNKQALYKLIKNAAKIEIESVKNNKKTDYSSFISFSSFEEAFKEL